MSDTNAPDSAYPVPSAASANGIGQQLVESLVHLLIEKGVLTRNDALSIVQTVAQLKRGTLDESRAPVADTEAELNALERIYSSFEALEDRPHASPAENVVQLRPPSHGDHPHFPRPD